MWETNPSSRRNLGRFSAYHEVGLANHDVRPRFFVHEYGNNAVLVILLVSLSVALFASVIDYQCPEVIVSEVGPISGTRGVDRLNESCQSFPSAHLFNSTSLDRANGWSSHTDPYGARYEVLASSDGPCVSIVEGIVTYRRAFSVPIQDYDSLNVSVRLEALSGSARVNLTISPSDYYTYYPGRPGDHSASNILAGQSKLYTVSLAMDEAKAWEGDVWFAEIYLKLELSAEQQATLVISSFDVMAHSSQTLSPVSFDIQATDGHSLLSDSTRPSHVYLVMDLSRKEDGNRSVIHVDAANETLYLPTGDYSATVSWSFDTDHVDEGDNESAEFVMRENEALALRVRLPACMLNLDLTQMPVLGDLWLNLGPPKVHLHWFGGGVQHTLYMPPYGDLLDLSVTCTIPWNHARWTHHYQFWVDSSSELLVRVQYPFVVIFDVVMTSLDFAIALMLVGLAVTLLVRYRHAIFHKRMYPVLSDPGLIPFLIIAVAALLPWFSHEDYREGVGGYSVSLLPPFTVLTQRPPYGPSSPYLFDFWWITIWGAAVLFWVPLLGLLREIGTTEPGVGSARLMWVMCPVGLALMIWFDLWLFSSATGWTPSQGFWLMLSAPVVMFIEPRLRKAIDARRRHPVLREQAAYVADAGSHAVTRQNPIG